jgi:ATP-dependent protease HslVU (ClpYQ) peptidase subunit
MSVIVYRDGIMAADTRGWSGNSTPIGEKMKIRRLEDGCLLGVVTDKPGQGEAMMDWFAAGCNQAKRPVFNGEPNMTMLVVRPDGQAMIFSNDFHPSGPIVAPYFAIGSGERYALGAFACGAGALQAVAVAIELDTATGGQVAALEHFPKINAVPAPAPVVTPTVTLAPKKAKGAKPKRAANAR